MSSWNDVYTGLVGNLQTTLAGLVPSENIGIGFPSMSVAMNSGQVNQVNPNSATLLGPLVMVYDRGFARDVTRWIPRYISDWVVTASGVTFSAASVNIGPSGTGQITIQTGANVNDSVGVWVSGLMQYGSTTGFSSATSASGVASAVASSVSSAFSGVLSATASGAVVTFTNMTTNNMLVNINTANVGSALYEVHRVRRNAQIVSLTNNPTSLDQIGEPISQMLGQMEVYYGYTLPDGSSVRVINSADACFWDNVQHNIARRDWLVELEYGVTMQDSGYPVLAAIGNLQQGY